jgi:hypothetical protein
MVQTLTLMVLLAGRPSPCAQKGGCPDDIDALCQPANVKPNWPTYVDDACHQQKKKNVHDPPSFLAAADHPYAPQSTNRFHLMDNVTRQRDGQLSVEGLNDINAIFQYRGQLPYELCDDPLPPPRTHIVPLTTPHSQGTAM